MGGEIQVFYTVERDDLLYMSSGKWSSKDYDCARMDEETANRVARRYPGSTVEKGYGYDFVLKNFEDVEPDASRLIQDAVITAKRDGQKIETIQVIVERAFLAAK